MKLVIFGLAIAVASIGISRYSGFLGSVLLIIGLSIMMKGKKNFDMK